MEEKKAVDGPDFRFISSSSSVGFNKSHHELGSNQNINDYMRDVKSKGRIEEDKLLDNSEQALALQEAEKEKGLSEFEEAMASRDEVSITSKHYHWQDKYRPRKPR